MKGEIRIPKGTDVLRYETLYDLEDGTSLLVFEFGKKEDVILKKDMYVKIVNKGKEYFAIIKKAGYYLTEFYIILEGEKRTLNVTLMNKEFTFDKCSKRQIDIMNDIMKKHGYHFSDGIKSYNSKIQRMILELEKNGYKIEQFKK